MYAHESSVKLHTTLDVIHQPVEARTSLIKKEAMLFRADAEFAYHWGGYLTEEFLDHAKDIWGSLDGCIIDSRHHMLMPGMIPCIPGWHTDDAPRDPNRWGGQPNIFNPEYETEHLLCIVDAGTGSLTEFYEGAFLLNPALFEFELARGVSFYKTADRLFNDPYIADESYVQVQSGQIAEFNVHSWHRGQPAKSRGFRWFIRITRNSRHKVENELRSNAQVYITDTSYGW